MAVPGGDFTHFTGADSPQAKIRMLLNEMRAITPPSQAFEKLSHKIETLAAGCMSAPENAFEESGRFTRYELRFLGCLVARKGKTVTADQVHNASYFDRVGEFHDDRVLDVRLCSIRKKIRGLGYRIETLHGIGWKLVSE